MTQAVHEVGVGMIPFTKPGASEAYDVMGSKAARLALDDAVLAAVAAEIGSDGPMCLFARTAWAEGRGEVLALEPRLRFGGDPP